MRTKVVTVVAINAGLLFLLPSVRGEEKPLSEAEARKLLQTIADNHLQPPPEREAAEILPALTHALASSDPHLRDDLAFTILSSWIYEKAIFTPEELRPLISQLLLNLHVGLGNEGKDDVFQRSFSALTLSVIVARDNKEPFLRVDEFRQILDNALSYFAQERDTRGFDEAKGWIHTVAHSSDLLKFLARSRHLAVADQGRILEALASKLQTVANVFGQGEDERMARVVISLLHRPDVDMDAFRQWLAARKVDGKFPSKLNLANLRLMQNTHHLLTSLWAEMSVDKRPFEKADAITAAVRDTLAEL
jgi:hypothetical protein